MIVSHNWLQDYVSLSMPLDDLTDRLTMTGLNLEGVESVGDDTAIDLEVTSNRADCLGHIGVAREISVIFDTPLTVKDPALKEKTGSPVSDATSVEIECPELCPQYSARLIQGIKIGPSPEWMQKRLQSAGVTVINNVVDITNYVMLECGQPLHAFDFDKLHGGKIIVRRGRKGEKITAIDQREYEINESDCVIADADRPVAIAGVMGGFDTEISDGTVNVLVESASFAPLSVRTTARRLSLHSPSSFRFERTVDRQQTDWASRRCCELILELAGGELLEGDVLAGEIPEDKRPPISMRLPQIPRLLGIEVPKDETVRILKSLGLTEHPADADCVAFEPPSWRRDLTRECDLIEEVARLYGYEKIPTDANVPTVSTARRTSSRVVDRLCQTLTALGFYEAITLSFVSEEQNTVFQPRSSAALAVEHSSRKLENVLRQSLIPSLLQSRRENERHGTANAELFEISRVYLSAGSTVDDRESEPRMLSIVSGRSFAELKGVLAALQDNVCPHASLSVASSDVAQFTAGRGAELSLDGKPWGWLGEIDRAVTDKFNLRDAVTIAEVNVDLLESLAELVPQYAAVAAFPPVPRDLNFVLDEGVSWQDLEATVREAAGPLLDEIEFASQYRGSQIDAGKKSYVVTIRYRSPDRTLTAEEIEEIQKNVVAACERQLSASLR